MKRFFYSREVPDLNREQLEASIEFAEKTLDDPNFLAAVMNEEFTHTYESSAMVATSIKQPKIVAYLSLYSPWWRWSRAIAYTRGNRIYLNKRKLNRSYRSVANTLAHELMHAYGYSHGNNRPGGKAQSVPYKIGRMVQQWTS